MTIMYFAKLDKLIFEPFKFKYKNIVPKYISKIYISLINCCLTSYLFSDQLQQQILIIEKSTQFVA